MFRVDSTQHVPIERQQRPTLPASSLPKVTAQPKIT